MSNETEAPVTASVPPNGEPEKGSVPPNETFSDASVPPNESVDASSVPPNGTSDDEPETFTREYVQNLRDESAKYRTRAKDRDAVAGRLHTALVAATGRLADPTDLAFNDEHLDDTETLTAAIDELLATKPHLGSRKPSGSIGQGASSSADTVDLAGLLRSRAS